MFVTAATCALKWKGNYVEDHRILEEDVTNFWHVKNGIGVSMKSENVVGIFVTKKVLINSFLCLGTKWK